MTQDESPSKKGFFYTLPGIITGIAAVITAVGGLILTLNQTGCFGTRTTRNEVVSEAGTTHNVEKQAANNSEPASGSTATDSSGAAISALKVSFKPERVNYSIKQIAFAVKEAEIEPLPNNQSFFKIKIKCINESASGFNFGVTTIRLKAGEDKYVPDDSSPGPYIKTVAPQSFLLFEFYFKLPADTKKFDILLYDREEQVGNVAFVVS